MFAEEHENTEIIIPKEIVLYRHSKISRRYTVEDDCPNMYWIAADKNYLEVRKKPKSEPNFSQSSLITQFDYEKIKIREVTNEKRTK